MLKRDHQRDHQRNPLAATMARVMAEQAKRGRPPKPRPSNGALAGELLEISERIRQRQDELRLLERERVELIRRALSDGWSHQHIADATGLSRGRIAHIISPAKPKQ